MENKKSILAGSVIASAFIGLSNIGVNAEALTNYSSLGSGAELRADLLNVTNTANALELKCGDSTKTHNEAKCGEHKKGKDGKCGEGKCGEHKKGKDGKCGENKKEEEKKK